MEMASVPRRDFLGGRGVIKTATATGGCATMAASAPSDPAAAVPKLAYVGCYTTKERDGHGEGINVYQIDAATGNWTHLQMLPEMNPSFLTFDRQKRMLYSADGDGGEATAYRVEAASGRLAVTNKQPTNGKNGVSLAVDATNRFLILANYSSGTVSVLPINTDGSLAPLSDLYTLPGKPGARGRAGQLASPRRRVRSAATLHRGAGQGTRYGFHLPPRHGRGQAHGRLAAVGGEPARGGATALRVPSHLALHLRHQRARLHHHHLPLRSGSRPTHAAPGDHHAAPELHG